MTRFESSIYPPPIPHHSAPAISEKDKNMAFAEPSVSDLQVKLDAEPFTVKACEETPKRTQFLSGLDQYLVATAATITFFAPCEDKMPYEDVLKGYVSTMERLLVPYDFLAGRLRHNTEQNRLEIDCNGEGVLLAFASSPLSLSDLGDYTVPNPSYKQLTLAHHVAQAHSLELPLFTLQVTRFTCGSFAVGVALCHCTQDGVASHDFTVNLAAFARGEPLAVTPFMDRTLLQARSPPKIEFEHREFTRLADIPISISSAFAVNRDNPEAEKKEAAVLKVQSMTGPMVDALKAQVMGEGRLKRVSGFEVATAHIWKSRFLAMGLADDEVTTLLFPVDCRARFVPALPREFAGNAVVPAYAQATVKELREETVSGLIERIQGGLKRLSDAYLRSALDFLEVNKSVPCLVNSFSVAAWMRLDLSAGSYPWGDPLHLAPVILHGSELVFLLPRKNNQPGFDVAIALQPDHMVAFQDLFTLPDIPH